MSLHKRLEALQCEANDSGLTQTSGVKILFFPEGDFRAVKSVARDGPTNGKKLHKSSRPDFAALESHK
jgi:hypothetical protein